VFRYAFMYHTNVTAWKFLHNSSLHECMYHYLDCDSYLFIDVVFTYP
jgi:hypothetical protein